MLDRPSQTIPSIAPPVPSVILRPGMRALAPGVERYTIGGGQTVVVDLDPGDGILLTDVEGGQPCELIAAGADGRVDPALIGAPRRGGVSPPWCAGRAPSGLRERLVRLGIDPNAASAVRLFGPASPPGDTPRFRAERAGFLIVSVPAEPMAPDAQDTATPIELRIERARPRSVKDRLVLPEPLADPLQDIRVNRATAEAYVVRAGEYIQIIDVAGRQCS